MTEEEITRFALSLKQAARIRAEIAQEKAAYANGLSYGQPQAAMPAEEELTSAIPIAFAA